MRARNIVVWQRVTPEKAERAKQFRQAMTEEERILWQALRINRLDGLHFRRQQVIDGFIVDFYCHAAELVIEVDGASHANEPEYDVERDRILAARGLRIPRIANDVRILRIANDDVRLHLDTVLTRIAAEARTASASSPVNAGIDSPDNVNTPPPSACPLPLPYEGRGLGVRSEGDTHATRHDRPRPHGRQYGVAADEGGTPVRRL